MNTSSVSTSNHLLTEIVIPGLVEPDGLIVQQRPVPTPGEGQALVEMLATGVSFAEQQMRRGRYLGQPKFPFVLGYDLVGVVTSVGPKADESMIGRRVAAVIKTGGWTTHAFIDAGHLVPVPDGVDAADAETVVVNGITAWQMLNKAKVRSGQTVLVHGANGGVGNVLVQLARHAGLRVIGTASPRHHDALRAMGADPIDYNDPHLADRVGQLAVGGATRCSTTSEARASSGRSSSLHAAERSSPTERPARGTAPATGLPKASVSTAGSGSGASFPMDVAPFSTTSGEAR